MRRLLLVALVAEACLVGDVSAAQDFDPKSVSPPPAAVVIPFDLSSGAQPVRFTRLAIQMPPITWARLMRCAPTTTKDYVTWADGQIKFDDRAAAELFAEVAREASLPTEPGGTSLFGAGSFADLQVGARITNMQGDFLNGCGIPVRSSSWAGRVVMRVDWELYSSRNRRIIARMETAGGYTSPKSGLTGDPERLIYEAFKDNARRLISLAQFRGAITSAYEPSSQTAASTIIFRSAPQRLRTISSAVTSVAAIFANEGHGTGFLVSADGHVLTNQHVVGASKYVKVRWSDGLESVGEVIRVDHRRDVALVKVDAGARAPLAYRSSGEIGQAVFAIGTPLDGVLQSTVTKGIISAKRTFEGQDFIQSDVAINPGNSGGPLLADDGTVIGLAVAGYQPGGSPVGLNLFIPIQQALDALALAPAS